MNKSILYALTLLLTFLMTAMAGIERIDNGGQELSIDDAIPPGEPGIIVFYASWDTASTTLTDEVESWSANYPALNIVFVDISDLRSQVCRQFNIQKIPDIIVFNDKHEQVGPSLDNVDDLEELLAIEKII